MRWFVQGEARRIDMVTSQVEQYVLASIRSICSLPDPSLSFRLGGVPVLSSTYWSGIIIRVCGTAGRQPASGGERRPAPNAGITATCVALSSIAFQTWQRPLRRIALPSRFTQAKTLVQRVRRERRLFLACLSRGTYCTVRVQTDRVPIHRVCACRV